MAAAQARKVRRPNGCAPCCNPSQKKTRHYRPLRAGCPSPPVKYLHPTMSELRAVSLNKKYGSRTVVHDASLSLQSGEVVGLLGPNGAGKTTSFYMIVGLIAADGGEISIDDNNITHLPIHRRARLGLGYLPQEASIFRRLTVAQNIQAVLELQGLANGDIQNH